MQNLLRCRRGSAALVTSIALVPLMGLLGLGAEAGSWYVIKRQAQYAADAGAYSGAVRLACSLGALSCSDMPGSCATTLDCVRYRGKQSAAQNGFCNATGDPSYPGSQCDTLSSGASQTVTITQPDSSLVQATVHQIQPAALARIFGIKTFDIAAQAVAKVQNPTNVCALALGRFPPSGASLTLGGSVNLTGNGCGLMSDDTVKYASTLTFSGSGWAVDAVNGCVNSGNCDPGVPHNYYMTPATNPLQTLDDESFNSRTGNTKPCSSKCGTVTLNPNSTGAYGNLTVTTGDYVTLSPGTYFFYNAAIKINGGTVNGTGVTLVLLGNSSLSITGATVNLSAPTVNTTSSDLDGVLIDDQAPNKSNNAVTVNGGGSVTLGGAMYFPNVDVTWSGTAANANTTCSSVIANSLTLSGNAYMSTNGCVKGTFAQTQVVTMFQ
jgi:hypothetical protein